MPAKKKGKGKSKKGLGDLESIVSSAENAQMSEETKGDDESEAMEQLEETPEVARDFEGLALATAEEDENTEPLEGTPSEGADQE